jgi:predicted ATPase/DNA-binding SARP family transcriptional activator
MNLQCFLFGEFRLLRDGVPLGAWPRAGTKRLCKLLMLAPSQTMPVAALTAALWPDADTPRMRQRLHHQIYLLNQTLGASARKTAPERVVQVVGSTVRLRAAGSLWIDTAQFEQAMDAAAAKTAPEVLERAIALYRGPLLPEDMDDELFSAERMYLEQRFISGLHALAKQHAQADHALAAIHALQRIVQAAPAEEAAHRHLIELYGRAGQLAQVERQFAACKQALAQAFASAPSELTVRAYQLAMRQGIHAPGLADKPVQVTSADHGVSPPPAQNWAAASDPRFVPPTPLVQLIGRAALIARYRATLLATGNHPGRLFTLLGMGGVGKTQLAIALANDVLNEFRHGACFVALAEVDADGVVERIARALGVTEQPHRALLDTLCTFLAHKHVLLVLDNFEHVLPSAAIMTTLLERCPLITLLVTSRSRLNLVVEQVLEVPTLADDTQRQGARGVTASDAAVQLFVQRAKAVQPQFVADARNTVDIAQIVRRLDALPLALELAAARIPLYGARGLRLALEQNVHDVVAGGGVDRPARHRSLAGSMAWSYGLLSPSQQRALHTLALFVEPFDLQAAQAVCAALGEDAQGLVQGLVEAGLLSRHATSTADQGLGNTYGVLRLTREFLAGADRALAGTQADTAAFVAYHLTHARALSQAFETGQVRQALRGFGAAHMSFFSALEHARQLSDDTAVCMLVRYLAPYWSQAGVFSRASPWATLAAQCAARVLGKPEQAALSLALGYYSIAGARPGQAHAYALEALELAQSVGDAPLAARASLLLSGSAAAIGKPEAGIASLERTQAYAISVGDEELLHKVRINLGVCFLQTGGLQAARAQWQACDARLAQHNTQARVSAVSNLALAAHYLGEHAQSQALCELALKLEASAPPRPSRVMHILLRQSWMLSCNNQPREAQRVLGRVRELPDLASLPNVQELLMFQRGKIDACMGNLEAASAQLAGALSEQPGRADPWDLLDTRLWLFWVLHMQGGAAPATAPILVQLLHTVTGWRQEQPRVLEAAAAWFCAGQQWNLAARAWQAAQHGRQASGAVRFVVEQAYTAAIPSVLGQHAPTPAPAAEPEQELLQHLSMQVSALVT